MSPVAVVGLEGIAQAIADQLDAGLASGIPGLQVDGLPNFNPTPPCIDVYPADPFMVPTAYDIGSFEATFIIRARVTSAEREGGMSLLYELLDRRGDLSVAAVLAADPSLGASVASAVVEDSGFQSAPVTGGAGDLLAATWRIRVDV